jgi:aspartate/methionine/tyrosine aminotransferase
VKRAGRLNQVNEYYFSSKLWEVAELRAKGKNILNFGIGSPDFPPHPEVIKELHEQSSDANNHAYQSYQGSPILRSAIARWYDEWYGVKLNPEKEILPLIGSKEGIVHICMTYLNKGDKALIPDIGYPAYRAAVQLAEALPVTYTLYEENNWFPDFDELGKMDLHDIKMMWMNYPNMPTGSKPTKEYLQKAVNFALKHNILLIHDNPYSFILNEQPLSIMAAEGAFGAAVELNSLSKSHNMAGWRVGMLVGAEKHIVNVLRFKSNLDSGMFLPAQLAASKALALPREWYRELNKRYTSRRQCAYSFLQALSCSFNTDSAGLFVWAAVPQHFSNGYALADKLLYDFDIFVTPGGVFGEAGDKFIRVSLCASEAMYENAAVRVRNGI